MLLARRVGGWAALQVLASACSIAWARERHRPTSTCLLMCWEGSQRPPQGGDDVCGHPIGSPMWLMTVGTNARGLDCLFAAISYFMRYPHQPHGTPPTGPVMPIMYPHLSCLGHLPSQLTPILPTLHNPPLPPPQCKSPIMSSSASKLSSHAVSMASPLLPCLLFTRFWFSIYSLLSVIR